MGRRTTLAMLDRINLLGEILWHVMRLAVRKFKGPGWTSILEMSEMGILHPQNCRREADHTYRSAGGWEGR